MMIIRTISHAWSSKNKLSLIYISSNSTTVHGSRGLSIQYRQSEMRRYFTTQRSSSISILWPWSSVRPYHAEHSDRESKTRHELIFWPCRASNHWLSLLMRFTMLPAGTLQHIRMSPASVCYTKDTFQGFPEKRRTIPNIGHKIQWRFTDAEYALQLYVLNWNLRSFIFSHKSYIGITETHFVISLKYNLSDLNFARNIFLK
jgi:hypothetical protein